MNMAFNRSLRPAQREPRFYRLVVFFERLCEAAEFSNSLLVNLLEPPIKAVTLSLSQHRRTFLDQFIGLTDLLIGLTQLGQILLLPLQTLLFLKGNPMRGISRITE